MDVGYGADDPALMLVHWKFYLRAVTNAIIDARIHTAGMTEDEAVSLMVDGGFQEDAEARAKYDRARLSSTQLSTYFTGSLEMWDIEREVRRRAAVGVRRPSRCGGGPRTAGRRRLRRDARLRLPRPPRIGHLPRHAADVAVETHPPGVNIERDVLDRLTQLAIRFYVTGSWALSVYAEPRMTRDLDLVVDLDAVTYERMVRPEFERDYLVNDPIDVGGRWIGGLVHRVEIVRIDLMFGRQDGWARSAFERSAIVDHPGLGPTPMISAEDLILAKLDWSDGGRSDFRCATADRSSASRPTLTGITLSAMRRSSEWIGCWRASVTVDLIQRQIDERVRRHRRRIGCGSMSRCIGWRLLRSGRPPIARVR